MHEPPAELDGFRVVPGGTLGPRGFVGGGVAAGIKATGALDLGAILSTCTPCQSAATFTTNRVCGASVTVNKERLAKGPARGIVFNSGNSNVFTGARGRADALAFIDAFAGRFDVPADEMLVASTGVIGFHLPMPKILAGVEALELTPDAGEAVARAMMTTDIGPKTLAIEVPLSTGTIRIGGAAKGAGMVHPNMATMFVFMTTDAEVAGGTLQKLLSATVADSFNLLSIDGDQSTSDTALLLANGASETGLIQEGTSDAKAFTRGLQVVCRWLAQEIVRGGEGVTKVFAVTVRGASDDATARTAARAVTTSSLVKTAIHGGDPNWGRIVMALGNSGAVFDPELLDIWIGDTQVVKQGAPAVYEEALVAEHFRQADVTIEVALNQGEANATAWGGDLSAEYVAINAEYMT